MIVFNTFNHGKRKFKVREIDNLIWAACLIKYKSFGWTTKLYCLEEDIEFLKKYHLYELYDIVDTEFLKDNEQLKKVNEDIFWSSRKIEAMYHELFELNEDAFYSDTDLIIRRKPNLNHDVLVWSPEPHLKNSVYIDWDIMSKPDGYEMLDYIKECNDAFNCGVWYFKNKEIFKKYREEYYKFVIGNPGIITHEADDKFLVSLVKNNNAFPCNAEQRILKAVCTHLTNDIGFILKKKNNGLGKPGSHYFYYKMFWIHFHEVYYPNLGDLKTFQMYQCLNEAVHESLQVIKKSKYKDVYEFYSNLSWLYGFEDVYSDYNKIILKQYF